MEIFDIHTHIAPGIDDGAENSQMTLSMLEEMYSTGVNNIILTPHYNERMHYKGNVLQIMDTIKKLAGSVSGALNIFPGNEVYYSSNTLSDLTSGRILSLANSKYILVEFSPVEEEEELIRCINEILRYGYWPILAHAERYRCLYKKGAVERLVDTGAYLQINADSVMTNNFKISKFVKKIISNNYVSFVASDCHNMDVRKPNLMRCAEVLRKKYGADLLDKLLSENPRCIIQNKRIIF